MSAKRVSQPVNVDPKKFVNICQRNISTVSNRLDDYITSQDEKNIHDIQTSVRRLDACYKTLPKKLHKKKQIKKFVNKSKKLFNINSQVRDFDVITELVKRNNPKDESGNRVDFKNFENRRSLKLEKAKAVAVGLRKLPVPNVKKNSVPTAKLNKRFNKLINKFGSRIQLNLPSVMTDSDKVAELHEMRKDCDKLQYLLELVPHGNSSHTNLSQLEEELQNMQDLLGAIYDHDATAAYLKRQKKHQRRNDIVENILQERKKRYENFLIHCKSDITNNNHSLLLGIARRDRTSID
jgi:CHAD domain-containing protein